MKKYYFGLLIILSFSLSKAAFAQAQMFTDYFDAYNAGEKLACQNSTDWTTWGGAPCGDEDALVTDAFFSSPSKSVVITQNIDLVKPIANLTEGNYSVVFKFYIPDGKTGYFNVLQLFSGNSSEWGIEVYLNAGGTGSINAGGNNSASFAYTYNEWHTVEVRVNIAGSSDIGTFSIDGNNIHTWTWSAGADGGGGIKQLGGVNFYGAAATDELYIDNFQLWDNSAPSDVEEYENIPATFELNQNYPNPFNPSTKISYSIPAASEVSLKVYNVLGIEVAALVNKYQNPGNYEVEFNAESLSTGVYFYTLTAGNQLITKKLLLLK
jgi:hypothetical protein